MTAHRANSFLTAAATLAWIAASPPVLAQAPAYCDVEDAHDVLLVRPNRDEQPIEDINWFARPVPNADGHWIVGYAMHDQNYLYDLTDGKRVRIPDKSDAVATPDGNYMTVPSFYTPDGFVRFYDTSVLLQHLEQGKDATGVEPVFIHENEGLRGVFYQSLGHIKPEGNSDNQADIYRMIFSGTTNESGFRMVDYRFDSSGGKLSVTPTDPIALCPEIENDLMTPFISKDGQYVAAYTSPIAEGTYTDGASLKIYQLTDVDYSNGSASCNEVVDFGFPAGKADFSYDGNSLTFHISNVSYLAVFINGGKVYGQGDDAGILHTDVMVADLTRDSDGVINGVSGVRRLTTSDDIGSGSYFPAFFPDDKLYYIHHPLPGETEGPRYEFRIVDPDAKRSVSNLFKNPQSVNAARMIGELWTSSCHDTGDYQYAQHELPFFVYSMTSTQCHALVRDAGEMPEDDRTRLANTCDAVFSDR